VRPADKHAQRILSASPRAGENVLWVGERAIKLARTKAGPAPLDEIDRDWMR